MEYNPFFPEVRENPYPYYAYLRQHAPVYQIEGMGFWAISRYDDVLFALKNPQIFSSTILVSAMMGDLNPFTPEAPSMFCSDPPYHTRQRKLVNRAFTPRRIASLETQLRDRVAQLLERAATQGEFDVVRDLAVPLPVMAIADLLGIPSERYQEFKLWADDIVKAMNGTEVQGEERVRIRRSLDDFRNYFRTESEKYRREPKDTLLSDLVRAEEENQTLTPEEVVTMAVLVLAAGSETTTNLLGNAMLALFKHPEQLQQVQANPALVPGVLEETLRYDAPVQLFPRLVMQDVQVAGTNLPAGTVVLVMYASANHDERKFPEPHRFDIGRNPEGHLAFGFGVHFCLGSQLARLEAKIALETLLTRFPRLARKDEKVIRIETPFLRGLKTLPLMVG